MPFDSASYVYRQGVAPNTEIAVSQKIKIYAVPYGRDVAQQIGVSSEFSQDAESRDMVEVRGVGYGDRVLAVVPGNTAVATISITRRLMYVANLHQVLGYRGGADGALRSLKHHRWPFDLKKELVFSEIAHNAVVEGGHVDGGAHLIDAADWDGATRNISTAIVTWYEGCWVNSYQETGISADGGIIDETVSATVTDVVSDRLFLSPNTEGASNGGNNPFIDGQVGSRIFQ